VTDSDLVLVVASIYVSLDIGLFLCQLVFATICCFRLIGFLFSFLHVFNISMLIYSFWESHFVVDAWVVLWQIQILSWLWFIYMCHGTLACSFANWCLQPFVVLG